MASPPVLPPEEHCCSLHKCSSNENGYAVYIQYAYSPCRACRSFEEYTFLLAQMVFFQSDLESMQAPSD